MCVLVYIAQPVARDRAACSRGRQARYGTLAASSVLIVLGILVAINYIGKQQNKRWDLTAAKQFSLSDQSRNVLAKLDAPLRSWCSRRRPNFQRFRDRLKEYEYASKQVKTEYIDPDKKPDGRPAESGRSSTARSSSNYKGRTERVTTDTEQDITNGIIKVVSGQQRKVYFTQGHGEKDTASTERDGYNAHRRSAQARELPVDKLVARAAGRGARRCGGRRRRRPADRFLPARRSTR